MFDRDSQQMPPMLKSSPNTTSCPSFGERRQVCSTFFSNWPRQLSCIPAVMAVLFPFSLSLLASPQPLYSLKSTNLHTGVRLLLRSTSHICFYWKVFVRNDAYSCACFLFSLCQAPRTFSVAQYFLTVRGGLLRAHSSAVFLFYLHMSP